MLLSAFSERPRSAGKAAPLRIRRTYILTTFFGPNADTGDLLKEVVMSTVSGESPRNLEQQRKLAKDLLKAVRASEVGALARLEAARAPIVGFKLADAQRVVAREGGFDSWPKLVKHFDDQERQAFRIAVQSGDAAAVQRLLDGSPTLRKAINYPISDFGGKPVNIASHSLPVMDVLLAFGADINARSDWKAGPFGVLDSCPEEFARDLIARGAILTPHAAARFGWLDELAKLITADPASVSEKGGDGQLPLHYAKTTEVIDYLLAHGADIDARCVDHHSTAAQYALKDRPEITRHLLERGATADIFMAARLGDLDLAQKLIGVDPTCLSARTNVPGYAPVPVFGIYNWGLGFYMSPHEVATKFGHQAVFDTLWAASPAPVRLLDAAMRNDEPAARAAIRDDPTLPGSLGMMGHSVLAFTALHNRLPAFNLMLDLGFDPMARGMDGGTVLHTAAWMGNTTMIESLLKRGVDVHAIDPTHGGTPLGWAAYGSVHRREPTGDYAKVIEILLNAGADIKQPGNKHGATMTAMAEGNPAIQKLLRWHGAS